jgi:pilus assembly protein CpaF
MSFLVKHFDKDDGEETMDLSSPGSIKPSGSVPAENDPFLGAHGTLSPSAEATARANLRSRLHQQLLAALASGRSGLSEQQLRSELMRQAHEISAGNVDRLSFGDQAVLVEELLKDVFGYGPILSLMNDHRISDILINGPRQVYKEINGQLLTTDLTFQSEEHLVQMLQRMVAGTGRRIDQTSPMVDARLPDGSRLNAVLKPPALNGPLVSIRRFGGRPLSAEDLLANESLTEEMLEFLAASVQSRLNMIVSGGTGSGKTTLLNALSRFIPSSERIVTIEDTGELELQQPHVAKMEAQPGNQEGVGQVTVRDLTRNALRMRPDRIIIGECRGGEALEMLQAMNTGHEGSLTTVHANSTRESLSRIELMVGLAGLDIPISALRKLIASSIQLVIQVSRLPGGKRKIVSVSEITGIEGDMISMHDLFVHVQTGINDQRLAQGFFKATGLPPHCLSKMNARGANLRVDMFRARQLQTAKTREHR